MACRFAAFKNNNLSAYKRQYQRRNQLEKLSRKNRTNVAKWIVIDSAKSDKKHGRMNDLTESFVDSIIGLGCSYCGESTLRMTVDRIDNTLGHLQSNVIAACIRCNYMRGNMPYEAWLFLIEGVRRAREAGCFGEWVG